MESADVKKVREFLKKVASVWSLYPSMTFGDLARSLELGKKTMFDLVRLIDEAHASSKTDGKDI